MLDIMIYFPLIFPFLPFVLAFPCSNCPPNNAFTHTDLLFTSAPPVEVISHLPSGVPLQPPGASVSGTKIISNQPAADASTGNVSSIPTQTPSPFYHNHQSSWRSEDISNVLVGSITALAALLALGIKYIFMPLHARGQQSGRNQAMVQ